MLPQFPQCFGISSFHCQRLKLKLVETNLKAFCFVSPLFADQGKKVAFYKRAQILVADTWSVLEGKGDGCFSDISSVTIFADYRIPQVLVHLGAMKYSEELMKKLKEGMELYSI